MFAFGVLENQDPMSKKTFSQTNWTKMKNKIQHIEHNYMSELYLKSWNVNASLWDHMKSNFASNKK